MNKKELVQTIAKEADVTIDNADKCLDALTKAITKSLEKNQNVTLVGFGTFQVKDRAAREGRNPKTGETIQIKASKVPSFKAGKTLKEAVNKK
ncbi:HU family DNA-binding protein [Francisellaceae bacterium CB52]